MSRKSAAAFITIPSEDPSLPKVDLKDGTACAYGDDPRVQVLERGKRIVKESTDPNRKGGARNTESFDPKSTLVRPEMRIIIGPNRETYVDKGKGGPSTRPIKHDDVIIVPEFFCKEDDWSLYYTLIEEMRAAQADGKPKADWKPWAEGAHLITDNPTHSKTYQMIQRKISTYFGINNEKVGTRFNWYTDSTDWKPFHHDSAAYNPTRAKNQNITVGVSFGATRELAFLHAKNGTKIYFPQSNGMMFSFGRDVNIRWKHGVNALSEAEQRADGRGRVSIILWGQCPDVVEEADSPPMLDDNTRGNGYSMHGGAPHRGGDGAVCRDHQRGQCRFGESCRFSHGAGQRGGKGIHRDRDRDQPHDRDRDRRHDHRDRDWDRDQGGDARKELPREWDRDRHREWDSQRDRDRDRDRHNQRNRDRDRDRDVDRDRARRVLLGSA